MRLMEIMPLVNAAFLNILGDRFCSAAFRSTEWLRQKPPIQKVGRFSVCQSSIRCVTRRAGTGRLHTSSTCGGV
jgi:hypothetical protein